MTTSAAGRRLSEVVRLTLTDSESERMLLRVEQGKGRKDRSTLLSTRLLTELRASRAPLPAPRVVLSGTRSPQAEAQRPRADNLLARQAAREEHARPWYPYAPALLCHASARRWGRRPDDPEAAGPSVARYHHAVPPRPPTVSRDDPQPVRPPALRGHGPAYTGVTPCRRTPPRPTRHSRGHAQRPPVGSRRYLPPLGRDRPPGPSWATRASEGHAGPRSRPYRAAGRPRRPLSSLWVRAVRV
jgi:hypothetical protein